MMFIVVILRLCCASVAILYFLKMPMVNYCAKLKRVHTTRSNWSLTKHTIELLVCIFMAVVICTINM
ncbi:hypothetical protein BDF19DRAFT_454001 [Syncephalis fuscata]|nr:hypothetical protein BDF19DRAFT_454001 [Syncephalis fuscata]